jgi:acyl-CoA synthetase (AMP-forming)/AMP-acid ligase II/acyl carrier protein
MMDGTSSRSIPALLQGRAESDPLAEAIAAPGQAALSYGELWIRVEELVRNLNQLGIGRNDRVALVLPNGPDMAVGFLGVSAGATAAPLNPGYRAEEFEFYLSDLGAKALIVQSGADSPAIQVAQARDIRVIELLPGFKMEAGRFAFRNTKAVGKGSGGLAQPEDVALVLHTSGTTSRPKLVPLTQLNLCTSAHNVCTALQLTPKERCLNVMPLFHIHGLVAAVLASLAAGGSVICTPGFYAPQFFGWLDECRPTWYTAVPTMHQGILTRAPAHREVIARRPLRLIRSSSAALPPQVLRNLEETFQVPVIEAYGMTEATHQMASNPLPPAQRKPGSVGLSAGPEIAIMDDSGTLLPAGVQGEVVIRGSNVTQGYENNPQANSDSFCNGWFRTGDQGCLDQDGFLFLTGRLKEIINRGGEKIAPKEVDDVLMDHPAVAQAVTFAVPDPILGEDVGAVIVLRDDTTATAAEIRDFAATRLVDFKVPRFVLFRDTVPKGPTGKLQRIGLAQVLELSSPARPTPPAARDFTPPRSPLEHRLAGLWADVLKVERPGIHEHFLDLGGDSMLAALLVSRIRDELALELSIRSLFDAPTVADQAAVIEESLLPRVDGFNQGGVGVG